MAMIVDPLTSRIFDVVTNMAKEEVMLLLGIKGDLERLAERLDMFKAYLQDAQRRGVQDRSVSLWLKKLRDAMYDADDIIDECEAKGVELQKQSASASSMVRCCYPSLLSCFRKVVFRHDIGYKIKGVNARLDFIFKEKSDLSLNPLARHDEDDVLSRATRASRQTIPLNLESEVVGIEDDVTSLVNILLDEGKAKDVVLAIVGMGGIGKTTLAQTVFNDGRIQAQFDVKIWTCVTQHYSDVDLLKQIIRSAEGSHGDAQESAELSLLVEKTVRNKRLFLVLDDVWVARFWVDLMRFPLQRGTAKSRILVTTRNELVAREMGAIHFHNVNLLSDKTGLLMLCKIVFGNEGVEQSVREIGERIVEKCHGLPLAIKTVAGVLKTKPRSVREWEKVLHSEIWSSSEIPNEILPALYLSYQDLPSRLKQCFTYCSLFPKGCKLARYFVVQYWISEGFVLANGDMSLEEVGEEYFKELVKRCLFNIDPLYVNETVCTMHDLIRDLATSMADGEYFTGGLQGLIDVSIKPRHASIVDDEVTTIPNAITVHESLRTILLVTPQWKNIQEDLFEKLRRLRVLNLSDTKIENLPRNIGNLIHLRNLNVSRTRIKELPESVALLVNLQFMLIQDCEHLHHLPNGIVQLRKLRSLDLLGTPLSKMPLGIGRLEDLRGLQGFVVTTNEDNSSNMEELKSLSKLTWLTVHHLERVQRENEANKAALGSKHLIDLRLYCDDVVDVEEGDKERIKQVFEELYPPSCVEFIEINGFLGRELPSWVSASNPSSLLNFRGLTFVNCKFCEQLPSLGRLPQLYFLHIEGASAIVTVGLEFFGGSRGGFPKLETMQIKNLPKWEDWLLTEWLEDGGSPLLPCLKNLLLEDCPKLKSIPKCLLQHAKSLTELHIYKAGSLSTLTDISTSVKKAYIWDCPRLETISDLLQLENLELQRCPTVKRMDRLPSLKYLLLEDTQMEALPGWLKGIASQLKRLELWASPKLLRQCLPSDSSDWVEVIQHISHVEGFASGSWENFSYTKNPYSFKTKISLSEDEESDSEYDVASSS
ncbi:putative disease resistance protein RGA3 [Acorus calamus]|uniref:Disease resistance protein RGA3 n=1 Tax=Acorus calamus TaxID=4465 RepID=A0AAV9C290_ACOCL|nr:putative disease resistance protein RGA3 [Acorus calamus]